MIMEKKAHYANESIDENVRNLTERKKWKFTDQNSELFQNQTYNQLISPKALSIDQIFYN